MNTKKSSLFRLNIFQQILFAMLVVAIAPLGSIWYIDYRIITQDTQDSIQQRMSSVSDKFVGEANNWVTTNLSVLTQNASLPDMVSMDPKRQRPILEAIVKEYKWSYVAHTIGPDGMNVTRSDGKDPLTYSDRDYFQDVMGGKPVGQQAAIAKATGKPALMLAVPIRGAGTADTATGSNQVVGVLTLAMHLVDLSEHVTKLRIGETGYAFLLDEKGKVIAHRQEDFAAGGADFSKHPAFVGRSATGKTQLVYEHDGRKAVAYVQTTQNGWSLVTQQDYSEAYAPIQAANIRALVILAVTLAVVSLIAYLVAYGLSRPIRNLTKIAEDLSRGGMVMNIAEVARHDEIGALAAAIDRMGASIQLAMERLKTKV